MLPWEVLRQRLTKIMVESPNPYVLASRRGKDACVNAVIRLRDIAEYTGIQRAEIYRVRRGERSLSPNVQQKLSWFFCTLDRGRLAKEKCPDGKWRIVPTQPQVHPDAPHAGSPTIEASVDFLTGRLSLGGKVPH